ncbi:MAG TPA: tetratricopeptide repeat protein [Chloroflexota bacterium]|nr:tetratricopeptide repeat protein [Chloroflexota bacterium]
MSNRTQNFSDLLRRRRLEVGLTQEELAERAGLSARAISDLERGRRTRPRVDTVAQLADALEMEPEARLAMERSVARGRGRAAAESPARAAGPLPLDTTLLIGREHDEAHVVSLFNRETVRLVTLTGPGGVGKTRLAYRASRTLADVSGERIVLVSLGQVPEPGMVLTAIAGACEAPQTSAEAILENIRQAIGERRVLLVLDNFEHVLDAATIVAELLASCSGLRVLATSREPLRLRAEHAVQVPPLAFPGADETLTLGEIVRYSAPAVFLDRVRAAAPETQLTDSDAGAVSEICRRLDGLPLALELAAPRLRHLNAGELARALREGLAAEGEGFRDLPERQRTMRAAVAWSYNLLNEPEKVVFRSVSVFSGGFDASAAGTVVSTVLPTVSAILHSLTAKNLLVCETANGERRFRMLEVIREFAAAELSKLGETGRASDAHAAYFLDLSERVGPGVVGPSSAASLKALEAEEPNLRVALQWLVGRRDAARGLRLCTAISRYWQFQSGLVEGRQWIEEFLSLDQTVEPEFRSRAFDAVANLAYLTSDYSAAARSWEQCRVLARSVSDDGILGWALNGLGLVTVATGKYLEAVPMLEEAVRLQRHQGDLFGLATALNNLGSAILYLGNLDRAEALYREALAVYQSLGEEIPTMPNTLNNLAQVALSRGDVGEAYALASQALEAAQRLPRPVPAVLAMTHLGNVALAQGDGEEAEDWYTRGLEVARKVGLRRDEALLLSNLSIVARNRGDLVAARALALEALDLNRRLGHSRNLAYAHLDLANVAREDGAIEEARHHYRECLAINEQIGHRSGLAECLSDWSRLECDCGEGEQATTLASVGAAIREASGLKFSSSSQEQDERIRLELQAELGEERFMELWRRGSDPDEAVRALLRAQLTPGG